ncbi:autotransporter outer membrane beta-barrel domain-containing protein [Fusobacterium perfoetens]|uniref:autotransporter outer membrane beta-barrel domain-containing protein n=1 Tax=Fusobacterium perfoetens TaxID=852 RepID=UPI0004823FD3|nr:autotransporter outer membrane beta-barrel domain-containing protein [Fusobacterium perfoetens]
MKDNIEKSLKRWLKRKVKVTLALITTFLITGSIGYADFIIEDIAGGKKLTGNNNESFTEYKSSEHGGMTLDQFKEIHITVTDKSGLKTWSGRYDLPNTDLYITVNGKASNSDGIHLTNWNPHIVLNKYVANIDAPISDALNLSRDATSAYATINYLDVTVKQGHGIRANSSIQSENEIHKITINESAKIDIYGKGYTAVFAGCDETLRDNSKGKGEIYLKGITNINLFENNSYGIWAGKDGYIEVGDVVINGYKDNNGIVANNKSLGGFIFGGKNRHGSEILLKGNNVTINLNSGKAIWADSEYGKITSENNKEILYNIKGDILASNSGLINLNIASGSLINGNATSNKGNLTLNFSGEGQHLWRNSSENNTVMGIENSNGGKISLTGSNLIMEVNGKQLTGESAKQVGTNSTVTSFFDDVTQGIKIEGKENKFEIAGINEFKSSDIAITSKNANMVFNGTNRFEGNNYLIQKYDKENLMVRPVIQAIEGGNISLSGNTTIISNTGEDGQKDDIKINNVGIYTEGKDSSSTVNGSLTIISGNDIFEKEDNPYNPDDIYTEKAKEIIENTDISLMATAGGKIKVEGKDESKIYLIGDIISGKEKSLIEINNGKNSSTIVVGEVLAANGGKVNLDMSNGGYFVGRVDDYSSRDFDGIGLRNDKFSSDITSGGEVTLNLGNNAMWNVIGQSFITNLNFTDGGGVVDLTYEGNALRIKNLTGEGTFNLTLNAEEKELGNMLYIYDVGTGIEALSLDDNSDGQESKVLTQKINLTDSVLSLDYGEKLRFATLGKNAYGKVTFEVNEVKERGINNVSFETHNEDYDINDEENKVYNGDGASANKPGDSLVSGNKEQTKDNTSTTLEITLADDETTTEEGKFIASENWYLTRVGEEINDGGKTILEMSRANYASAVYMDNLNKRLGDMSFVDGDEGIWTRIRNDRVGEDKEYRLRNNMYQLGYDKTYPMDDGKGNEYRGIALEYTEGTMEYKNIIGEADIDRVALWLYDTNVYNDGFYSDYVFRVGRMSNNFSINGRETGAKVEGDFRNLFLGASAEFGKRYDLTEKTYFEPQAQLQYTYIEDVDYTTNQGTRVDYSDIHSLIGRIGFRLGHDFYNDNGKDNTIYLKADVNHEFLGEQDVNAVDMTGSLGEEFRNYKNKGTWYDVGIGAAKNMTENLYVYADIERQFGHRDDNSWQFNLGFRYKFSSIKDFSLTNLFDFDKSEIKPEGKETIEKVSKELNKKKYKGTLKLEGHTDWTGTREYNQGLSERRAKAVEEELKKNVTNEKLKYETKGYGEDRPVVDNRTKEGRAKNRRVEVKYEK